MDIRLVASDLDDTLLAPDKTLTPRTVAAIAALEEKGIAFVIATGRVPARLAPLAQQLRPAGVVANGGAVVFHGNKQLAHETIPAQMATRIALSLAATPGLAFIINGPTASYTNTHKFDAIPGFAGIYREDFNLDMGPVEKFYIEREAPDAALPFSPGELGCHLISLKDGSMQMMSKTASKLHGVQRLCRVLDIPLAQVAFFGDDDNDVALLAACGHGVAVANATPAAQQAARHACPPNSQNGVAAWLEKHVL